MRVGLAAYTFGAGVVSRKSIRGDFRRRMGGCESRNRGESEEEGYQVG